MLWLRFRGVGLLCRQGGDPHGHRPDSDRHDLASDVRARDLDQGTSSAWPGRRPMSPVADCRHRVGIPRRSGRSAAPCANRPSAARSSDAAMACACQRQNPLRGPARRLVGGVEQGGEVGVHETLGGAVGWWRGRPLLRCRGDLAAQVRFTFEVRDASPDAGAGEATPQVKAAVSGSLRRFMSRAGPAKHGKRARPAATPM